MEILKRTSKEKQEEVIKLYNSGLSQIQIEKDLKITRKTIRTILKNSNCKYRSKSEAFRLSKNNTLNTKAFDNLTEESLYWIGFLYADGHLSKNDNSIQLALKNEDEEHLQKFLDFLECNLKITSCNKGKAKRIRIYSKELQQRLRYFGFDNNKSVTAVPHEELKNSRDFWRGVVDGDGGLHYYDKNSKILTICGTYKTVEEFCNFLKSDKVPTKAAGKDHFQVAFYGKESVKNSKLLYNNSKVYLERKYKKYLQDFAE